MTFYKPLEQDPSRHFLFIVRTVVQEDLTLGYIMVPVADFLVNQSFVLKLFCLKFL